MTSTSARGINLFFSFIVIPLLITPACNGGKILVFTPDGSHWINMKILIEELHARGHSIDVVRPSTSVYIKEDSPFYGSITIPQDTAVKHVLNRFIETNTMLQREGSSSFTFLKLSWEFLSVMSKYHFRSCIMLTKIFENQSLVQSLSDAQYDLVLTDPAIATGVILAKYLKLPMVLNVRWITSGDGQFAIAPSPLSYVPVTESGLTDKMSFIERLKNLFFYSYIVFQDRFIVGPGYKAICDKYIQGRCDTTSLFQEADIWLFRSDFVFDFPRPTMPNVVYIGGFQCKPAQPLPSELEEFVQSAGEHGVIIMTMGSFVNALPDDMAEAIATVFAKMPQKVIWKHNGQSPSTLGKNTRIVDWMPQKDLLGHPQTKVFVAHGGTNGVQEAIYHGVPVLGIPLFFDQFDNLLRLQERGAGKIIKLVDFKNHRFEQGLKEVLHQDSYRQNMQRLSLLHRDQPISPMDRAIFWTEYVIRHKGAAHLRTEAYKMPWYSYYSIDVLVTLLAAGTFFLLSPVIMFRFWCCRGRTSKVKQH